MTQPTTREELIAEGARTLGAAGVDDPARDARLLLRWASGLDAAAFAARLDARPGPAEAARFAAGLAARASRRPLSQVTGRRAFWGRDFIVTPDVLDPRPETETLIAAALEGPLARTDAEARILDLGVGSGCILLTLLAERPFATGLGVDRSADALDVARRNAQALGVAGRASWLEGDWFQQVRGRFDLVVSNPPYIPDAEFDALAPEVRLWEPTGALAPGGDGLAAYRAIAKGLDAALADGGGALIEFGAGQADAVARIFDDAGFAALLLHRDLDDRPRCLEIARNA
ncbi:MAG: peptide chain release factor N(5)-glutamine methyltransferase [Pseudomonadota bacterium]